MLLIKESVLSFEEEKTTHNLDLPIFKLPASTETRLD